MVANQDGKLKPFSRDTLFIAVYESCRHRPAAIADATALTQIITTNLLRHTKTGTIEINTICATTHTILQRFDKVAATMYRAYHPNQFTS
ncbi:MAG TPA: hypothetical protein VJ836_03525 [Candidatus Saccharimonadales bacterium]|nr:hypothetical protein [Candidatus Saccharimonadales bacterium]